MSATPPFTVVIPAHNEEAVIARCLNTLREGKPDAHPMHIIVVANGCADSTADIARQTAPEADIIELDKGSKTGAINAGNAAARHVPRIYLDADVECSFATLAALAQSLSSGMAMIASPAPRLSVARSDRLVQAYYRVWQNQPFAKSGKGGAGCYALSRAALHVLGSFPEIIADDAWVHSQFRDDQRCLITHDAKGAPIFTTVHPPRTVRELIRVEARKHLGNRELKALFPSPHPAHPEATGGAFSALRSGAGLSDVAVYAAVKIAARILAALRVMRGRADIWARDKSSRLP